MNAQRFTEKAQEAIVDAQRHSEDLQHTSVEPLHLLLALIEQEGGVCPLVVEAAGVSPRDIEQATQAQLEKLPKAYGPVQRGIDEQLRQALRAAEEQAQSLRDEYVSTEHLLLALVGGRSTAAQAMTRCTAAASSSRTGSSTP